MSEVQTSTGAQLLGKLSTQLVQLMKETGGSGPTKTKSYFAGPDTILVVMRGGYTVAEETLYRGGRGNAVRTSRHAFHDTTEVRMRATVEATTGRRVVAFLAASHQDPDLTVLTFMLNPTEPDSPMTGGEPSPR